MNLLFALNGPALAQSLTSQPIVRPWLALTPAATNSLYWPWFCNSTGFWQSLVKELLQGMLPAIISTFFDTYAMPLAFYFISQA